MERNILDVHHHIIPDIYRSCLLDLGVGFSGGKSIGCWTPEMSLQHMEALGVQTGFCSISEPALYPVVARDPALARKLARQINEYMADLKQRYPGRFGAFAVLPMPDVPGSIQEAEYALQVLGLDGIGLLSNYGGEYLGDSKFDPIMETLQGLGAVVYVHPSVSPAPEQMPRPEFVPYDYMMEFCFNTTRAAVNLILSGTTRRCPAIRFIFSHMGGTAPYLGWRVDSCFSTLAARSTPPAFVAPNVWAAWSSLNGVSVLEELGKFYYDTALSTHPAALFAVEQLAPDHILFGSDSFYASQAKGEGFVRDLTALLEEEQRQKVFFQNAAALFHPLINDASH